MLKKALETGNSVHKDACWGTWRGFVFQNYWEADEGGLWKWSISFKFNMGYFLVPDYVRSFSVGQSGTTVKDQGSYDLVSVYEAQRACFKN